MVDIIIDIIYFFSAILWSAILSAFLIFAPLFIYFLYYDQLND